MTVEQPPIVWQPAHPNNYTKGRGGKALEFIVLHIAEGTLEAVANWFANPAARASTHYGVGKDGRIHQYVSLENTAYAHGAVEVDYANAPRVLRENWGTNPNQIGVGIEHEGRGGDVLTPAQFDASTRLAAWLFFAQLFTSGATGVAVDRDHVLMHREISPKSRTCPGWPESEQQRYVARVADLLTEQPAPPPLPGPSREIVLRDALTATARGLEDLSTRARMMADSALKEVSSGS